MPNVIYIVGPTASGKTNLAISIASKFGGEIICADSRTIYKGLDIGTAKPTKKEMSGIPHYGLDLIEPNESFSASVFYEKAKSWIKQIQNRNNHVVVVGGTGLYVDSLFYDFSFMDKPPIELRSELEKKSVIELQEIINSQGYAMPENEKNKRYLIRAIERKGRVGSRKSPSKDAVMIGLRPPKEVLLERISKRADQIKNDKILEECQWLFKNYGYDAPGATGNIYKSLTPYFKQKASLDECFEVFKKLDYKLAKRQMTWFKRNPNISWFEDAKQAEAYLADIL